MKKLITIISVLSAVLLLSVACKGKKSEFSAGFKHPQWSYSANIYELNTRQFTPEGTFEAALKHLPRLSELGVKIIWLMPIHPIGLVDRKGHLGSYYAVSDYCAVNPEFGTVDDLKVFVDQAHSMDMKVIIDWVANHTSRDPVWLDSLNWFVLDSVGVPMAQYDWSDVAKLNYDNPNMRSAMIDAMMYWVREVDVDGFRCDVAGEVPTEFWERAKDSLVVAKPDLFMLAEAEKPELHNKAFDMSYAWELHSIMNKIAKGEESVKELREYLAREKTSHPNDAFRMIFTSNHDENSWNGTEFERMGDAAKSFAVLSYVLPGMPLIYNGQEIGFDRRLEFFKKDSIDWNLAKPGFSDLYTKLNALKRDNHALWCGEMGGQLKELEGSDRDELFAFVRDGGDNRIFVMMNLSAKTLASKVTIDQEGDYVDVFTGESIYTARNMEITLGPWEYKVYKQDIK